MKEAAKEKRVELLFEVGCEEIPAGMLPKAEEELRAKHRETSRRGNLFDGVSVETFGAPRRLTAWVRGMLAKQADVEIEVTGPPKSVPTIPSARRHARHRASPRSSTSTSAISIWFRPPRASILPPNRSSSEDRGTDSSKCSPPRRSRSHLATLDDLDRPRWRALHSSIRWDRRRARRQTFETLGSRYRRCSHHSRAPLPRFETRFTSATFWTTRSGSSTTASSSVPPPRGENRDGTRSPCQAGKLSRPRRPFAPKAGGLSQRIPERHPGRF